MADSDARRGEVWEEIHGFASPGEFRRFSAWVNEAVREEVLVEVPVEAPYSGSWLFDEHWYRAADGGVWRVITPEPPFRGVFERVRT